MTSRIDEIKSRLEKATKNRSPDKPDIVDVPEHSWSDLAYCLREIERLRHDLKCLRDQAETLLYDIAGTLEAGE